MIRIRLRQKHVIVMCLRKTMLDQGSTFLKKSGEIFTYFIIKLYGSQKFGKFQIQGLTLDVEDENLLI